MLKDRKISSFCRILKGNHPLLRKIKLNRPSPASNLSSHLITKSNSSNQFSFHQSKNTLFAYDNFTYSQIDFTSIHELDKVTQIIGNLENQNQLFVHLNQDNSLSFNLDEEKNLQKTPINPEIVTLSSPKNQNHEKQQHAQLGFIESLAKKLFSQKKEDQTFITSVIGFSPSQIEMFDLLDFKHIRQKVQVSKIKKQIHVCNLTQTVAKQFQSFLEIFALLMSSSQYSNSGAVVYQFQIVKLKDGDKLEVEEVRKKVTVVKLFGDRPYHINAVGRVLHQISNNQHNPISIRSSKLTTFIGQLLNLKTEIQVVIEIDPKQQELKRIVGLFGFCNYFGKRLLLKKNYLGSDFVAKRMSLNNLNLSINQESKQRVIFPRLQSLMTGTLSSVSKRKPYKADRSLGSIAEETPKYKHEMKKIYNCF